MKAAIRKHVLCMFCIWQHNLTLCIGFLAFDGFKNALSDENGNISGPRTVLAGFGAGMEASLTKESASCLNNE